jgi:putative hydrolase of the HAD superfamily
MLLPRVILFDLDDTIITEGGRASILLEIAEELTDSLSLENTIYVADQLEGALENFWASSADARAARLGVSQWSIRHARQTVIEDVFRELSFCDVRTKATVFCDRFSERRSTGTRIYSGARETTEILKEAGVALALVTNGAADIQRAKIKRFSLAPLFDHIQIEGEHGFGKPDEQAYLHAMSALGVNADDTWMVGDNLEWEVAAPQRLNIKAIWHDHRGMGIAASSTVRPDRIIRQLPELFHDI